MERGATKHAGSSYLCDTLLLSFQVTLGYETVLFDSGVGCQWSLKNRKGTRLEFGLNKPLCMVSVIH